MRLGKMAKAEIVHKVLKGAFPEAERDELKIALGKAVRLRMELPDGWERYMTYMWIASHVRVEYSLAWADLLIPCATYPRKINEGALSQRYGYQDLTKEEKTLARRYEDIMVERQGAENDLKAVLSAVTTTKQLMSIAPELAQYLPVEHSPLPVPVEVVQRARLVAGKAGEAQEGEEVATT